MSQAKNNYPDRTGPTPHTLKADSALWHRLQVFSRNTKTDELALDEESQTSGNV